MSNTLFNLCIQVIAMDGMYAGFAGAKTGHGYMAFSRGLIFPCLVRLGFAAFPSLGWCDMYPVLTVMSRDGRYAENAGAFFCGGRKPREIWLS